MKKESVNKFDLEAAFKALEEIEIPVVKGIKPNRENLQEKFTKKSVTEILVEDYFDVNDQGDLEAAQEEREAEIAKAKLARIEKIVDLDAESEEDLLPSYVGKFIIQCPQCMTLFYKNQEDIEKSEENPEVVNINEVCQHCGNTSGYTLIGKVDNVGEEEAENYDVEDFDENELNLDFDVEEESTEEEPLEDETAEEGNEEELELEPAEETEEENSEEEEVKESLTLNEDVEDEEVIEDEISEEEVEEILTSVEEVKEVAVEAAEAVLEASEEETLEDIKEVTDEVVEDHFEISEEEIEEPTEENEEEIEESLNEEADKYKDAFEKAIKDKAEKEGKVFIDVTKDLKEISKKYTWAGRKSLDQIFKAVGGKDYYILKADGYHNFYFAVEESKMRAFEAEKKKHYTPLIRNVNEELTEAVDKELDDKLKAHNEYIEYLKEMIEKEEKSLASAKNDFVKKSIQSRIDALKADLEAALPEALKGEVETELPTAEEVELEATENTEEKEEAKESLKEGIKISDDTTFQKGDAYTKFKKQVTDREIKSSKAGHAQTFVDVTKEIYNAALNDIKEVLQEIGGSEHYVLSGRGNGDFYLAVDNEKLNTLNAYLQDKGIAKVQKMWQLDNKEEQEAKEIEVESLKLTENWDSRVAEADKVLLDIINKSSNEKFDDGDGYWCSEDEWCNRYLYYANAVNNLETVENLCAQYSTEACQFYVAEDDPVSEIGYILKPTPTDEDLNEAFQKNPNISEKEINKILNDKKLSQEEKVEKIYEDVDFEIGGHKVADVVDMLRKAGCTDVTCEERVSGGDGESYYDDMFFSAEIKDIYKLDKRIPKTVSLELRASDWNDLYAGLIFDNNDVELNEFNSLQELIKTIVSTAQNESLNEDVKIISDLSDYEPWSGAVDTWNRIQDADKLEELDAMLEETYPDGLTMTELNDILWFDSEWVLSSLGIIEEVEESLTEGEEVGVKSSSDPKITYKIKYSYRHTDNQAKNDSPKIEVKTVSASSYEEAEAEVYKNLPINAKRPHEFIVLEVNGEKYDNYIKKLKKGNKSAKNLTETATTTPRVRHQSRREIFSRELATHPAFEGISTRDLERYIIDLYLEDDPTAELDVEQVVEYVEDLGWGKIILDNIDNLSEGQIRHFAQKDPVFISTVKEFLGDWLLPNKNYSVGALVSELLAFLGKKPADREEAKDFKFDPNEASYKEFKDELTNAYYEAKRLVPVGEALVGDVNINLDARGQSVGLLKGQGGEVHNDMTEDKENLDEFIGPAVASIAGSAAISSVANSLSNAVSSLVSEEVEELKEAGDLDTLLDSEEFKKPISDAEVENILAKYESLEEDVEPGIESELAIQDIVDTWESVEEIDEESLDKLTENYLTEVYSNVKSFKTTDCSLAENKLVVEGKITFNSGKSKYTKFIYEAKKENGKVVLEGLNADFATEKAFVLNCKLDTANCLVVESLNYKYTINNTLVEGLLR